MAIKLYYYYYSWVFLSIYLTLLYYGYNVVESSLPAKENIQFQNNTDWQYC